jgi:hypothetical protein
MKGVSKQYYRPQKVFLDSQVQPLMLGKVIVEGLLMTDVNLEPCMY